MPKTHNFDNHLINRVPHVIFLYWVIKIASTTLGETGVDMFSMTYDFGYATTILIFMALFGLFLVLPRFYTKISTVLLFWLAFVLTRPFGATFGDLLTKTHEKGGLDLGAVNSSLFFAVILVLAVAKEVQTKKIAKY